jgi:cell filamentation protein
MNDDPYVYPHTEILKNKFGERDEDRFRQIEADYTGLRIRELMDSPLAGAYDLSHLCRLHQYIFQDIFEWAGRIRTVNMEKAERVLGGLSVEYSDIGEIEKHLKTALAHLNETKWQTLNADKKALEFSQSMAEIWKVHPFREGNTRTIVTFCCDFADKHEFSLNRDLFSKNSVYVRTALVAASAVFHDLGDRSNSEYLVRIVRDAIERVTSTSSPKKNI